MTRSRAITSENAYATGGPRGPPSSIQRSLVVPSFHHIPRAGSDSCPEETPAPAACWSLRPMMWSDLAEVSQRHPGEFILMVLDGADWHKARRLQVPATMRLVFLPPGTPQLNPV